MEADAGGGQYRYLDAAATAPLRAEARAALLEALDAGAGNASSVHSAGHRAAARVDAARETVAQSLGARPPEVVFTSGGTEANNLAVIGLALANPRARRIVTSPIEHPSVAESCAFLHRLHGFEIVEVRVDRTGRIDLGELRDRVTEDTSLVTIGLANGEIGTVQPMSEIAEIVSSRGALLHTDAVQAAASLPVSFAAGGWPGESVQAMSVASHKFGGPQGAGALLLRFGVPIEPLLHGGDQELGRRAGTENIAALAGFAAAVRASSAEPGTRAMRLVACRELLVRRVLEDVPGAMLTGHPAERLPGHASFVVEGVSGESLLVALDAAGIAASSGSACAAGRDEPSPALLALGIEPTLAHTAIRFTMAEPIDAHLIERVVEVLRIESARARRH